MKKVYNMELCNSFHSNKEATDGTIYPTIITSLDPDKLEFEADARIPSDAKEVNIYVNGPAIALIAALNVCKIRKIKVTLWHFNVVTGKYFNQRVW